MKDKEKQRRALHNSSFNQQPLPSPGRTKRDDVIGYLLICHLASPTLVSFASRWETEQEMGPSLPSLIFAFCWRGFIRQVHGLQDHTFAESLSGGFRRPDSMTI